MDLVVIILIVLAVLVVIVFVGGLIAVRRRDRQEGSHWVDHVARADQMLARAAASDKGWDRPIMEEAVHRALREGHPDFGYDEVHLVQVEDAPGTETDAAHFVALGSDGERRVVLRRTGDHWAADRVE